MPRMPLTEALQILHAVRRDEIVVPTMSAAREWMKLGTHPLDFIYAPSSMGQATALGLGIALAQPQRQVIVLNGDGCLLMNLGSLVTIAAQAPANLCTIVIDNGVYEVTGSQPTAASHRGEVNFAGVARASGFTSVWTFSDLESWRTGVTEVLTAKGPRFVVLQTEPMPGGIVPKSPAPAPARARQFALTLKS
ncbi:MAG TPA: thiamine pyrophosphate-dependent enzyme [Planctomycetaceae bacterium]|nr:thiamine pyrophosphate-dependent enzyme [Planctomycetaceae bacterium]